MTFPQGTPGSGGVDATQAMTFLQWLDKGGAWALAVSLVFVGVWFVHKFSDRILTRYDDAVKTRGELEEQRRKEHKEAIDTMRSMNERYVEAANARHAATLESWERDSRANREACIEESNRVHASLTAHLQRIEDRIDRRSA